MSGQKCKNVLSGFDVVVFDFHGFPQASIWCGDSGLIALKAETLSNLQLNNAGVFALSCYAGDTEQPMAKALECANAKYLIAGAGRNYAGTTQLAGVNWLLRWYMTFAKTRRPESALMWAKRLTQICAPRWTEVERMALKDSLQFTLRSFE